MEISYASSYECGYNPVGERFTQLPDEQVSQSLPVPFSAESSFFSHHKLYFSSAVAKYFREIQRAVVLGTWPTLRSSMERMGDRSDTEFLNHNLVARQSPYGQNDFTTHYLWREAWGSKFARFVNAMEVSPRENELQQIIQELDTLLEDLDDHNVDGEQDDEDILPEIQTCLDSIRGENRSTYVRPELIDLAEAGKALLEREMEKLNPGDAIVMERYLLRAVHQHHGNWLFDNVVDVATLQRLNRHDRNGLSYGYTTTGHKIVVAKSHFIAFAPYYQTFNARFSAVRAYFTLLQALNDGGIMSKGKMRCYYCQRLI